MSDDPASFFSRWSRRKAQARTEPVPAEPPKPLDVALPQVPAAAPRTPAAAPVDREVAPPGPALPTLEDVAELGHASDYSRFVAPGVDSNVRNAAMKKLFTDPHFNIMDGLDIYIDDYGKPDPIPPEMLRQMVQSKVLGLFDDEENAEAEAQAPDTAAAGASATCEEANAVAETAEASTHEPLAAAAPPSEPTRAPDADDVPRHPPPCGFVAAAPCEGSADNPPHDDNAYLQLQPDDAAGCAGVDQGARSRQV